jgi:ubiquitin-activating enzyme E1
MGHTQTIIPNLTESYNSSNDKGEQTYPLCAVTSFPTIIEHCIIWAQEQLEEIFCKNVFIFKEYVANPDTIKKYDNGEGILLEIFNSIPHTFDGCYLMASKIFEKLFCDNINELLNKFPKDYVMDDGTLFWTEPKRCPHIIPVNDKTKLISDKFVNICAKLWMSTFTIPKDILFPKVTSLPEDLSIYKKIIIKIQKPHAKLVYYGSTLRALNYDIPHIDEFNSAKISEKIIPRLGSTSSMVAGLAILEFCKIVQKKDKIEDFTNNFIDKFGSIINAEPIGCDTGGKYSIWDSFIVNSTEVKSTQDFIDLFQEKHNITITAIIYGNFMFYSTIFDNKKLDERLKMSIVDIIEKETQTKLQGQITLQIYDDSDDDDELPNVLFII